VCQIVQDGGLAPASRDQITCDSCAKAEMLAAIDFLHFHDASLKLDDHSLAERWQTSADRAAILTALNTVLQR